jgi:hypothetical protein
VGYPKNIGSIEIILRDNVPNATYDRLLGTQWRRRKLMKYDFASIPEIERQISECAADINTNVHYEFPRVSGLFKLAIK